MEGIIGGEFSIPIHDINKNNRLAKPLFSSGRGAFAAILEHLFRDGACNRWGGVLLPDYLCSSITRICIDQKTPYDFYHVNDNLTPDEKDLFRKAEENNIVLLISYFGVINTDKISERIKEKNPKACVIIDDVQDFYADKTSSAWDYRFNSYRKWFAVPDGAEVSCKSGRLMYAKEENNFAQYKFSGNILKNFSEWVDDKVCLALIEKGEEILDRNYNCKCSEISRALIPQVPFSEIRETRKKNASFLHDRLEELGIKHICRNEAVPLFVPIFLENRDSIRKEMFRNNIFTPAHWPYESPSLNGNVKNKLYDTELSLICDQRYSRKDMERQLNVLETNLGKESRRYR